MIPIELTSLERSVLIVMCSFESHCDSPARCSVEKIATGMEPGVNEDELVQALLVLAQRNLIRELPNATFMLTPYGTSALRYSVSAAIADAAGRRA